MKTDFCVIAFPKCGTTAMSAMLEASPDLWLAKANGQMEAPFFVPERKAGVPDYKAGKLNGHKYSAYIYSIRNLKNLLEGNRQALLIIMVRSAGAALLSWKQMHQQIARNEADAGTPDHFAARDDARHFYAEGSLEEYYTGYADKLLNYGEHIERMLKFVPDANFMVVGQRRLAEAPVEVMSRIHARLGVFADPAYLNGLPKGYKARGNRDLGETGLSEKVISELKDKDDRLQAVLAKLDPADVVLGPDRLL